jgi:peptidyl-prolyl cis-trans isomerase B (cyclophilin B)
MATRRAGQGFVVAGLLACAGLSGCGQSSGTNAERPQPMVSIAAPPAVGEKPGAVAAPAAVPAAGSFGDAVTEFSPDDQQPPPDRTRTGLSTGKLREEVVRRWKQIAFTSPSGKALAYTATLDTEFGPITIALRPEIAPNHVRNFVALAQAGYYDGLLFEHLIQQQGEGGAEAKLDLIEGGCPLGTGEPGIGHLGYWLKPEFNEKVTHEPGTVGACRDAASDSAACRFYITLSQAPAMDGNFTVFGKVVSGLDVARIIMQQPRAGDSMTPEKPVVIRRVTVQTREVDKAATVAQN